MEYSSEIMTFTTLCDDGFKDNLIPIFKVLDYTKQGCVLKYAGVEGLFTTLDAKLVSLSTLIGLPLIGYYLTKCCNSGLRQTTANLKKAKFSVLNEYILEIYIWKFYIRKHESYLVGIFKVGNHKFVSLSY